MSKINSTLALLVFENYYRGLRVPKSYDVFLVRIQTHEPVYQELWKIQDGWESRA